MSVFFVLLLTLIIFYNRICSDDLEDFMKDLIVNNRLFRVEENTNLNINFLNENDGVFNYEISLKYDKQTIVKDVVMRWYEPMRGVLSVWIPTKGRDRAARQWFSKNNDTSSFYRGAPILSVCDKEENFQTFALSDANNSHNLAFFVDDFTDEDNVCMQLTLFDKNEALIKDYSVILRIDTRKIPYYQSIKDITEWWKSFYKRQVFNNEFAEYPLYSTWYNFHQHPNGKLLERELEIARNLGFKTVIIDDGWQYDGNGTGDYFDCGLWEVSKEKFANFKEFVNKIHELGMKIAVWFPVPFVGYNTKEYIKLKDKMLWNSEFYRAGILDPRYLEVRSYIVGVFKNFMQEYDLDGLKLDFIDEFKLTLESPAFNSDMDCQTVEMAVEKLLTEIVDALKSVKPELLIEFRQAYVGPAIVSFCNMLRVADCAFDSLTNRIAVTDLRLPEYNLAVHSDMLYWSKHESLENIKRQLFNVFFSVPQISVLLTQSSKEHLALIKNHLQYWEQNKDIILHGNFVANNLEENYPVISSENDNKRIVVLHDSYSYDNFDKNVDLLNAGCKNEVYLDITKKAKAIIYDIMGQEIKKYNLKKGLNKVFFPIGGRLEIRF